MIEATVIVALIMGIIEGVKKMFPALPKTWIPVIDIGLGMILGILAGVFFSGEADPKMMVFDGIIYGLTACGLYSGGKNVIQNIKGT